MALDLDEFRRHRYGDFLQDLKLHREAFPTITFLVSRLKRFR